MPRYLSFISLLSLSVATANATTPVLTEDLKLQTPYLKWQQSSNTAIGLSAQLVPKLTDTDQLYFDVQSYTVLPDNVQPPNQVSLAEIADDSALQALSSDAQTAEIIFDSTIPIICSVVFGTDMRFGKLASNPNMMASASIAHRLILTDLQANTVYFYRIQGIDEHGTVYFSDIKSFSTVAASINKPVNLASLQQGARIIAVSSQFGGGDYDADWGGNKAIDDTYSTAWSSRGDGNDAFIEMELVKAQHITQIGVWSRSMPDDSARIQTFTLTLDSGEILGPFTLPDARQMYYFDVHRDSQRLRFDVIKSTGGNTGLIEFSAF